ncbi:MAG: tRNA pseudouridine(38-40) synthase TruA [Planctomycetales bacterium]|nr:tRNA pseudouridine(38-40) synthase TruA [Planctomycetales bacterium]
MRRIKLVIHYDGTGYHGWQRQPDHVTIQETIEAAMERLCGGRIELLGSSRTDAGVHAVGQVAHCDLESPIPACNLAQALNNLLPEDIVIAEAADADAAFDAIGDTKSKWYRYTICTEPVRPVLAIRHCWHRPGALDVEKMREAAAKLVGQKDFKSFAAAADQRQSSIRTILKCSVAREDSFIYTDVEADGFLYNMVRNIVGTLVEVGRGRWEPDYIDQILAAKDRSAAGPIAPACGLCLMEIHY